MAIAFSSGQRFKFPNNNNVYVFISIRFDDKGSPLITYADENEDEYVKEGIFLSDLVHA
jgi:hypothetical protein